MDEAPRTSFEANRIRAEQRYRRSIKSLLREVEKKLEGLTDPIEIMAVLKQIYASKKFEKMCLEAAQQTVTLLAVGQKSSWKAAAAASSKGRLIYKALKAETSSGQIGQTIQNIVLENAELIKTVPRDMARNFSQLAQKRWVEGVRPETIAKEMQKKASRLTETEAKRIARTESAKASTALVQARAEALGKDFYYWRTMKDERVRSSHHKMEGVICRWSDPPSPEELFGKGKSYGNYHPGGIFNCRCRPAPIIAIEDIRFPAKCYASGKIITVNNLDGFSALYGVDKKRMEE